MLLESNKGLINTVGTLSGEVAAMRRSPASQNRSPPSPQAAAGAGSSNATAVDGSDGSEDVAGADVAGATSQPLCNVNDALHSDRDAAGLVICSLKDLDCDDAFFQWYDSGCSAHAGWTVQGDTGGQSK